MKCQCKNYKQILFQNKNIYSSIPFFSFRNIKKEFDELTEMFSQDQNQKVFRDILKKVFKTKKKRIKCICHTKVESD